MTPAYMHSLMPEHHSKVDSKENSEVQHNVFMGLTGDQKCRVYCLPDNYEVFDASLNDIKFNLLPVFSKQLIEKLDS